MWYPATVTVPPTVEPVTWDEADAQLRLDGDTSEQYLVEDLIQSARAHVEAYCGARFATQTVAMKCDCFADLTRLPEAPVASITSIAYVDPDGAGQTLSTDVYELRADGLEAAIVLKYNQSWPSIQAGSRITVTAVVGFATVPADVKHALKLLVGHWFENREAAAIGVSVTGIPHAVDDLLSNHRRGA